MKRRILSIALSLTMLTGAVPASVNATINPIITATRYVPGYTISVEGVDDASAAYAWQISTDGEAWDDISEETGADYVIKNSSAENFVRVNVTSQGETVPSNSVQIGAALTQVAPGTIPTGVRVGNDSAWLVTIENTNEATTDAYKQHQFTLLDTEGEGQDSEYFCYSAAAFATAPFNTSTSYANTKFDFDDSDNIAYWLDNQLSLDSPEAMTSTSTVTGTIPSAIRAYMVEHDWLTEAGNEDDTYVLNDSVTCGKIALMSYSEYIKYCDKFGYQVADSGTVRLRSPNADRSGYNIGYNVSDGELVQEARAPRHLIRPCFYLNSNFFKEVKLDISATGSEVKKIIVENYTKDEMSAVYEPSELTELGYADDATPPIDPDPEGGNNPEPPITDEELTSVSISVKRPLSGYTAIADVGDVTGVTYQWKYSSDGSSWDNISGETSASYVIKNDMAQMKICVSASKNDTSVESNVITIGDNLPTLEKINPGVEKDIPEEYVVTIEGSTNTFSILDTEETENGNNYFCYANFANANAVWTTEDQVLPAKFDPENSKSVAYWMNNETNGMIAESPQKFGGSYANVVQRDIVKYAIMHDWRTEKGAASFGDVDNDYVVNARFALLSYYEYNKYKEKIGYGVGSGYVRLRTPSEISTTSSASMCFAVSSGKVAAGGSLSALVIRPCFYIDDSFFKNVKLDLNACGSEVKKIIAKNFTEEELLSFPAGYTKSDVDLIGYESVSIDKLLIKGVAEVGETLSADFSYINSNTSAQKNAVYQWYTAATEEGTYTPIAGATSGTYRISAQDLGKYIKVEVKPLDSFGNAHGSVMSAATPKIRVGGNYHASVTSTPVIDNVTSTSAILRVDNDSTSQKSFVIAMALFDESNKLIKMDYRTEMIPAGGDSYGLSLSGFEAKNTYYAKIMVFESLDAPKPIYSIDIE